MPLVWSFTLSKKRGKHAWVEPIFEGHTATYKVHREGAPVIDGTINRKGAKCACCGTPVEFSYIREESRAGRMSAQLLAIVGEGARERVYFSPTNEQELLANVPEPSDVPNGQMPKQALGFRVQAYGIDEYKMLFTNRQLTALTTFSDLTKELRAIVEKDAASAGIDSAKSYSQAVSVYLAFLVDQMTNQTSSICGWNTTNAQMRCVFARQALPMAWDYAECNVFSESSGSFSNLLERLAKGLAPLGQAPIGVAQQFDAQKDSGLRNVMVSTDPPYYDNIGYADLSDFFYVWLRRALKGEYPDLFSTMLVPKSDELIATPFRFNGNMEAARKFFEDGMERAFNQIYCCSTDGVPVSIYYAFKQSESEDADNIGAKSTSSSGWETMLSAMIRSGLCITGTWPISTEKVGRTRDISSNALASSIVLVCRKRPADAPMCTRRDFINALKRELKPALQKLQASNIAPVDLAQSAIGPGMGVYSRYSKVLEADGNPMSVRSALQIINQELDLYFNEQDGELDKESRFCVELYTQCAFNDIKFGEADVLARAKNTSVDKLRADGVLYSEKGVVHLLTREEIPMEVDKDKGIWLLTQQLTRAMETDGVMGAAKIVKEFFTSEPERAKALAYRLFTLAERRGWAAEAYAYNSLIVAWPDVQSKAAELSAAWSNAEQQTLFTSGEISSGEV